MLTNNGSGGFLVASTSFLSAQPGFVVAKDMNGDGHVDLISANPQANTLSLLTNNGLGGFVLASSLAVGTEPFGVVVEDVNGDGRLDLISVNAHVDTLQSQGWLTRGSMGSMKA